MKFNHKKWDSIVQKKKRLHEEYLRVNDDLGFERRNYTRSEEFFIRNYGYNNHGLPNGAGAALESDKALSSVALIGRIGRIKESWPAVCANYGFSANHDAMAHKITALLGEYLSVKKLMELQESVSNQINQIGQSFAALENFARRHVKIDDIRPTAMPDTATQWGGA